MTNSTNINGYWQVINNDGKVISQRAGSPFNGEYMRDCVWDIPDDYQLVFVESSDHSQPDKFFNAHRNGTKVIIYDDLVSVHEHIAVVNGSCSVSDLHPHLQVAIQSLEMAIEDVDAYFLKHDDLKVWSAFIDDKWVGTSEY